MADTSIDQAAQDSRPSTTPPNSSTKPAAPPTPINPSRSGKMPLAATPVKRQDNFESFRRDISGKIIGPMNAEDFLKTFLPSDAPPVASPDATNLKSVNSAKTEVDMYIPFINAFNTYVTPGAKFVNSHKTTLVNWEKSPVCPDVVLLDSSLDTTWASDSTSPTKFLNAFIGSVGITLEFKTKGTATDPFTDDPKAASFEIGEKEGKSATEYSARGQLLGQISAYATAHMANQFRTHVFSVLVFSDYARILYWDRAGIVVTEKISLQDPSAAQPLAEFFSRYAHATPVQRGVDPNAEQLSAEDLKDDVKAGLDKETAGPFYKITLRGSRSSTPRSYIVAVPQVMAAASPTGRSTRIFKAYDMQTRSFVFLKDSWRIIGGSLKPEHERYSALVAAGVQHIPTVVDFHDMEDQRTRTSISIHATRRGAAPNKFRTFQHYRLVLKEFAKPLQEFADVKELLTVMADTIQAHNDAFIKAHILHRDISAGNIMIYNGRGLLVDWDLSKSTIETDDDGTQLPERTGTWQFIAYRLVGNREDGDPVPVHNKEDDVESFFHVLYWVALRRCQHLKRYQHVQAIMREVYDGSIQVPEHGQTRTYSSDFKMQLFENANTVSGIKFASPPLRIFLHKFHSLISQRYLVEQKYKDLLILWRDEMLQARPEVTGKAMISELRDRLADYMDEFVEIPRDINPSLLFQSLEPNWAPRLYFNLFGHDSRVVDWATGSSNIYRKELDTPSRRALEKRKSDTSTLDGSDVEDAGHPNKKPRREPGDLPSVHEAEE